MAEFATSIDIEAPPEVVFAHLVTPEGMLAWMGQHAELDARPGGVFAVDIDGNPGPRRVPGGRSAPRGRRQLGRAGQRRAAGRLVTGRVPPDPIAAGTRLDLTHTGLPADEQPPHAAGWAHCLARLAHAATSTG